MVSVCYYIFKKQHTKFTVTCMLHNKMDVYILQLTKKLITKTISVHGTKCNCCMQTTVLMHLSKGLGTYLMLHFSTPLLYTVELFAKRQGFDTQRFYLSKHTWHLTLYIFKNPILFFFILLIHQTPPKQSLSPSIYLLLRSSSWSECSGRWANSAGHDILHDVQPYITSSRLL